MLKQRREGSQIPSFSPPPARWQDFARGFSPPPADWHPPPSIAAGHESAATVGSFSCRGQRTTTVWIKDFHLGFLVISSCNGHETCRINAITTFTPTVVICISLLKLVFYRLASVGPTHLCFTQGSIHLFVFRLQGFPQLLPRLFGRPGIRACVTPSAPLKICACGRDGVG